MQVYEKDVNAWANEQAGLLRAGQFTLLDIEHIADEIESGLFPRYVPLVASERGAFRNVDAKS